MRSRRLRARSAWAAATGSSLGRITRMPAEVCSIWLASSFCWRLMLLMVRSYILAVPRREIDMIELLEAVGDYQRPTALNTLSNRLWAI